MLIQVIYERVSANISIQDSPLPHVFPPICLRQSPAGRGNTRHAHIRDIPLIMPLATWVEKQDSQVAGVLLSGAWHSLCRHPVAPVCNFVISECTDAYSKKQASPKEKNLYFSSTALLYISRVFSLPRSADTSIMRVLSGKWKLVMSASTVLNL